MKYILLLALIMGLASCGETEENNRGARRGNKIIEPVCDETYHVGAWVADRATKYAWAVRMTEAEYAQWCGQ